MLLVDNAQTINPHTTNLSKRRLNLFFSRACSSLFSLSFDDSLVKHLLFPLLVSYYSMATSHAEPVTVQKFAIPALAKDLIAGTVGGWAQVVVGKKI